MLKMQKNKNIIFATSYIVFYLIVFSPVFNLYFIKSNLTILSFIATFFLCFLQIEIFFLVKNILSLLPSGNNKFAFYTSILLTAFTENTIFLFNFANILCLFYANFYINNIILKKIIFGDILHFLNIAAAAYKGISIFLLFVIFTVPLIFLTENYFYYKNISENKKKYLSNIIKSAIIISLLFAFIFSGNSVKYMKNNLAIHPVLTMFFSHKENNKKSNVSLNIKYINSLRSFPQTPKNHYNVILIIIESLRQKDFFRHPLFKKELLPALNKNSFCIIKNMFSQAPESVESLKAIMTGTLPYKISNPNNTLLIQDIFKTLGYSTAFFNSTKNEWKGREALLKRNFDFVFDIKKAGNKENDKKTIQTLIDWAENNKNRPFFCMLLLNSTHVYYRLQLFGKLYNKTNLSPKDKELLIYQDAIGRIITNIKNLCDFLQKSKLNNNTIIIITGDHGEFFGEHNLKFHANALYKEVINIPLIFSAPKNIELMPKTKLASHIDILPSLLGILGLKKPDIDGTNIFSKNAQKNNYAISWLDLNNQISIINGKYHYIRNVYSNKGIMLFNLKNDPKEMKNIYEKDKSAAKKFDIFFKENILPYF